MGNEIILYQTDELPERFEVRIDKETVWLNRQQMAALFNRDVKTIGKHINNIFSEGELVKEVVIAAANGCSVSTNETKYQPAYK